MRNWVDYCKLLLFVYLVIIVPCFFLVSYFFQKLSADLQARVGPNLTGPIGIFQPIAEAVKLLRKGFPHSLEWTEELWFAVHVVALFSTVAVLPLGSWFLLVDTEMSVFLPFFGVFVLGLGMMILGINQVRVEGRVSGLRIASQVLTGAFPALISIVCVGIHVGSFQWSALMQAQNAIPLGWNIFGNPFLFVSFFIFVISGLTILCLPPLDSAMGSLDLQGGVSFGLGGKKLLLFQWSRFYGFFLWSTLTVALFLGGWNLPENMRLPWAETLFLVVKVLGLIVVIGIVTYSNPRPRTDQITDFIWKVLSPVSLVCLVGSALWKYSL